MTLGTRVIDWDFIVAEIGEDEGILGNDFAMVQELTVGPHEGGVYLPAFSSGGKKDMGKHRSVGCRGQRHNRRCPRGSSPEDNDPGTPVSQVSIIVPTLRPGGTVMLETVPVRWDCARYEG